MIPSIFVSSTIEDLHHLRDAVRDTIEELGYTPVMSEYGEVGYLPSTTAEESCYSTIRNCQFAVILIGKRYGELAANSISVTHNEVRSARDKKVPMITLVEQDVLTYKDVYDATQNRAASTTFPGMDAPENTFALIQEIADCPLNNGILPISNVTQARSHLKRQLADIFGNLLTDRYDPLKAEIKDVLSEIKTLRHELKPTGGDDAIMFLRATRYLLDDAHRNYGELVQQLCRTLEDAVPVLLRSNTFDEFLENANVTVETMEDLPSMGELYRNQRARYTHVGLPHGALPAAEPREHTFWAVCSDNKLMMNELGRQYLELEHEGLRKAIAL